MNELVLQQKDLKKYMTNYPTKEEILDFIPNIDVSPAIPILKEWKKTYYKKWSKKPIEERIDQLKKLVESLNTTTKEKALVNYGNAYCYYPPIKTVQISSKKASIISTLHEFGHHIFGTSELHACAFSTKLFIEVFPKDYQKLTWKGHLLVKK